VTISSTKKIFIITPPKYRKEGLFGWANFKSWK